MGPKAMQKYSNLIYEQNNWRKDLINKNNGQITPPLEIVHEVQKETLNC